MYALGKLRYVWQAASMRDGSGLLALHVAMIHEASDAVITDICHANPAALSQPFPDLTLPTCEHCSREW